MELYYFGCWSREEKGHYLYRPSGAKALEIERELPWPGLDPCLCPGYVAGKNTPTDFQVQGSAALHQEGGWSALAWWDRSADVRHGSNSALIARGLWTADQLLAEAAVKFMPQMKRVLSAYSINVVTGTFSAEGEAVKCSTCGKVDQIVVLASDWRSLPPGWLQRASELVCSPGCALRRG